jgi:uncharacterized protein YndB with AHSA1/START domain
MTNNTKTDFSKDLKKREIRVIRSFIAPVDQVWDYWTKGELLDQWWAPKPWKTETKSLNFREGGSWLYAMVGPDSTRHWARADFKTIVHQKSFQGVDCFCDENGVRNHDLPTMNWTTEFRPTETGTQVTVKISFPSVADLEKTIGMGFEAGFTAALGNLELVLETQSGLRIQ